MKLFRKLTLVLLTGLAFISCQKEYSQENGGAGAGNATGTLKAAGTGECLPSSVQGVFIAGTAVNSSNFINVDIDFTALGAYTITTNVVNGYSFSASGVASTVGVQTVKLNANTSGIPTAAGANTFTVAFGTSQCNIVVDVFPAGTGNAVLTLNCAGAVLSGTYTQAIATTAANTVQVEVAVTTAGIYNISTAAVNGVSFSGSGMLPVGTQMITLTANGGTPATSGLKTYTVTAGTSTCTFDITYAVGTTPPAGGTNTWSFKVGTTTYSGTVIEAETEVSFSTPGGFGINGETAGGDGFSLGVTNFNGALTASTYPGVPLGSPIPTGRATLVCFYESSSTPTTYDYIITAAGNVTTIISAINTTTRTIQGTFSGTAVDENNATVNITEGKFSFRYP